MQQVADVESGGDVTPPDTTKTVPAAAQTTATGGMPLHEHDDVLRTSPP
jgi:hypothetical protein